jgi:hypothetical protein
MKQRTHLLIPLLAISVLAANVSKGTTVFYDTFSGPTNTVAVGSTPDVDIGGGATLTGNNDGLTFGNAGATNSIYTSGAGRQVGDSFSALGAGKILTLSYDTVLPAGALNDGWAGISLYNNFTTATSPGTEDMFLGEVTSYFWGKDGAIDGGQQFGTDSNLVDHLTLTYAYDTGAWTMTSSGGTSLSGTGTAHVALNGFAIRNGGGADIDLDNVTVDISAVSNFTFAAVSPANGSYSGSRTSVSLQAIDGSYPVNTNSIVMKVDGGTVAPSITKSNNVTTINYVPGTPLTPATLHTAQVTLADSNGGLYTNAWSFTTAFQSLPSTLPGPIVCSNQEVGIVIFSTNDAWMGANYGASSGKTIYARFSMEFDNLNGQTNNAGGGYGGLHFFLGGINGTGHVIVGDNWTSTNWSVDYYNGTLVDLTPVTPIVFQQWHTIVERVDLVAGNNANISIWLDPDFTQTEANQPNPPLTGSAADTFDTLALRTGDNTCSATFSNIIISATSAGAGFVAPATPQFMNLTPASNDMAAAISSPISAQVAFGTYGIGTNTVVLTLDGNTVNPTFTVATNSITVNYQPPTNFIPNSMHTVTLSVTDSNNTPYSITWPFTVDPYPTLPVTIPGPIDVSWGVNGNAGIQLFSSQNEWIGTNYLSTSTNTLYTQFSMTFYDLNGKPVNTGYGGLEFYLGNTEQFLIGDNANSTNWSVSVATASTADIPPVTPIVLGSYHNIVVKSVYSSNAPTAETVWLDPDFTKSELNQPNAPLTLTCNDTFDSIYLRAGNGSAAAEFSNMVFTATSPFAAAVPAVLSLQKSGANLNLSWTGTGTLESAPAVTGPWTTNSIQTNPQVITASNSATFFRLQQ